jgi:hypothetical protein
VDALIGRFCWNLEDVHRKLTPLEPDRMAACCHSLAAKLLDLHDWPLGKGVDHLAWPGVVQLFAGLMLNCVWTVLEAIDMALQQLIFTLQTLQLMTESTRLLALLLVGGKAVLTEHDVVSEAYRNSSCCNGCNFAPAQLAALAPAGNGRRGLAAPSSCDRLCH